VVKILLYNDIPVAQEQAIQPFLSERDIVIRGVEKELYGAHNHTLVKDLIADGTVETTLTFSETELQSIYWRMMEIDIFGEKQLIVDDGCFRQPSSDDYWTIRIGGVEQKLHITTQYCELTEDAQALMDLRNYIVELVSDKEEYKALPEPNGGYL